MTRGAQTGTDFGWEIRRFGALVIARSDRGYPTADQARDAGGHAVAALVDA